MIVRWLQGDPTIHEQLKKDPIWERINHVHVADTENDIIDMVSQYTPDLLLIDSGIISNPIGIVAKILQDKDTRIVVAATYIPGTKEFDEPTQQFIDFCIDNGVYDIITDMNSNHIKKALFDGHMRNDVLGYRSSNKVKVSAESVIKSSPVIQEAPATKSGQTQSDISIPASVVSQVIVRKHVIANFSMKSVGKTSCTINTAIAISKMGLKVAVIDLNNITPDLGAYVGIKRGTPGIERFFTNNISVNEIPSLVHHISGIDVIPMGSVGEMSAVPMQVNQMNELISALREKLAYDVVMFDLSPDLNNPTNRLIIKKCDMVILVVNQLPATVENMYNQIIKMNNFCEKPNDAIKLVVNNYQDNSINVNKIKSYLNVEIIGKIPHDHAGFTHSVKTRTPYVVNYPKKLSVFTEIGHRVVGYTPQLIDNGGGLFSKIKSKLTRK
jgi:MinD-like ATPase involved in chromosome partitioning or flagellar assembly